MNEIWQLIVSNRQWIFEGLGVFILGGILLGLKRFLSSRSGNAKPAQNSSESVSSDDRKGGARIENVIVNGERNTIIAEDNRNRIDHVQDSTISVGNHNRQKIVKGSTDNKRKRKKNK